MEKCEELIQLELRHLESYIFEENITSLFSDDEPDNKN